MAPQIGDARSGPRGSKRNSPSHPIRLLSAMTSEQPEGGISPLSQTRRSGLRKPNAGELAVLLVNGGQGYEGDKGIPTPTHRPGSVVDEARAESAGVVSARQPWQRFGQTVRQLRQRGPSGGPVPNRESLRGAFYPLRDASESLPRSPFTLPDLPRRTARQPHHRAADWTMNLQYR